jgi:hypothetical protein
LGRDALTAEDLANAKPDITVRLRIADYDSLILVHGLL